MSIYSSFKLVVSWIAVASGTTMLSPAVHAQTYPDKPIRIVVPYGTGGGADVFARVVGSGLEKIWKQGIAVDNRAGASGNIGTLAVVRSRPDGYTLLLQNITMVTNYAVQGRLPYTPSTDLTPILMLGSTPWVIVANPKANIHSLQELTDLVKKNPGTVSYASCGIGTPQHLTMEVLNQALNLDILHVGYKGCSPAMTDVIGGQVPVAIVSANLVAPYLNTGKLTAIGVTSSKRYEALPNVRTIEEQGVKSFNYDGWYALMGPSGMAPDVVAKITESVSKVLDDTTVQKTLYDAGIEVKKGSAKELSKTIADDSAHYYDLARKLGIKPE